MAVTVKQVRVSVEASKLGEGLKEVALVVKKAAADGWQTGQDLPPVVTAVVANLLPAVTGAAQLGPEYKEDKASFLRAVSLPLIDLVDELTKEDPPALPPVA